MNEKELKEKLVNIAELLITTAEDSLNAMKSEIYAAPAKDLNRIFQDAIKTHREIMKDIKNLSEEADFKDKENGTLLPNDELDLLMLENDYLN